MFEQITFPHFLTIIWGLSFATIVTLIFVPTIYYAVHKVNNAVINRINKGEVTELEQAEEFERKRLASISDIEE